jgi:hypothetical protein
MYRLISIIYFYSQYFQITLTRFGVRYWISIFELSMLKLTIGYSDHRISVPAYAIEQQWYRGFKKWKVINVVFKNDARSLHGVSLRGTLSKIIDTPVYGRPSFFRINSVHQIETSLSHALLVYLY